MFFLLNQGSSALNYCPSRLWQHSLLREMMFVPQHVYAAKLLFNPPLKPSNTFLKQFESQTTRRTWLVGKRPTAGWDDQRKKKHMGSNEVEEHDSCRENIQRLYWPYCVGWSIKLNEWGNPFWATVSFLCYIDVWGLCVDITRVIVFWVMYHVKSLWASPFSIRNLISSSPNVFVFVNEFGCGQKCVFLRPQ